MVQLTNNHSLPLLDFIIVAYIKDVKHRLGIFSLLFFCIGIILQNKASLILLRSFNNFEYTRIPQYSSRIA